MLATGTGYENIRDWLSDHCGMSFPEKKRDLLTHRMAKVQERFGLSTLDDLAGELTSGGDVDLKLAVIHAASTNHTYFFREPLALDFFRDKILTGPHPKRGPSRMERRRFIGGRGVLAGHPRRADVRSRGRLAGFHSRNRHQPSGDQPGRAGTLQHEPSGACPGPNPRPLFHPGRHGPIPGRSRDPPDLHLSPP